MCGFGDKQIWRYEKGESDPTGDHLAKMAYALEASVDYLLGLVDEMGHFTRFELSDIQLRWLAAYERVDTDTVIQLFTERFTDVFSKRLRKQLTNSGDIPPHEGGAH